MHNVISITTGTAYRASRTPEELGAELSRLAGLRELVPARSSFGDNNHEAIDAQMRVLRERMGVADVAEKWDGDDDADQYILTAALDAAEWRRGEGDAPSVAWLDMAGDEEGPVN